MNIWIDLANSPHVLFFQPIVQQLETSDHNVLVTHRDFAQTKRLCKIFGVKSTEVGIHGGQGAFHKIRNIIDRAQQLRNFAKGKTIDIAASHNSYAHCIAAKTMGIRYVTIMDYEYQPANHINFRLSDKILVPFTFELKDIRKFGANGKKLVKYPGLKEEVYLWQFNRDQKFWNKEFPELDSNKVMCIIRPPATMAAYHNFENPIINELLRYLLSDKNVQVVFFPRTQEQRLEYMRQLPNLFIASKSVDGAQLIANSDLIISAGGTMNREAAVLGTPAYTIFAGKEGSVDRYLKAQGKIIEIKSAESFQKICLKKKKFEKESISRNVFDFIVQEIIENKN